MQSNHRMLKKNKYIEGILGKNSDRMTFVERMGNSISGILPYFFWSMLQVGVCINYRMC